MNNRSPRHRGARLIEAAMSAVAIAAVAFTAATVVAARRGEQPLPVAPGLAALSDEQIADLLPKQSDFPAGWTRNSDVHSPNTFGYATYHAFDGFDGFDPVECRQVAYGIMAHSFSAASIREHDPADHTSGAVHTDIGVEIGRQFSVSLYDDMRQLVNRCAHFHDRSTGLTYTVRVLEDSQPAEQPQRFRYTVIMTDENYALVVDGKRVPPPVISTRHFSYAQMSGLILSAEDQTGDERRFGTLFDATLRRIQDAHIRA